MKRTAFDLEHPLPERLDFPAQGVQRFESVAQTGEIRRRKRHHFRHEQRLGDDLDALSAQLLESDALARRPRIHKNDARFRLENYKARLGNGEEAEKLPRL